MPKHSHVLYDAPMPPPYAHSRIRRVPATATNARTTSRARRIVDHSCPQIRRLLCDSVPRRDTTLGRLGAVRSAGVLFLTVALLSAALAPAALAAPPGPDRLPRRALWIEVSANLRMLASRETIRALVERARAWGIDTLIPEAKNAWGFVIYESAFAPHIRTSPVPRPGYPPPVEWYPPDFDALQVLIEEAHAAGLRVHAAVNTFGEGLRLGPAGPVIGLLQQRPAWERGDRRAGPGGGAGAR